MRGLSSRIQEEGAGFVVKDRGGGRIVVVKGARKGTGFVVKKTGGG